jgi:hypothetical protein
MSNIKVMSYNKIIYVDIDETICTKSPDGNYANASPITARILKINKLYEENNKIVYWTARGTGTGINWEDVTKKQFEEWNVKYHELKFGKPIYDLFIDDKNLNSDNFFNSNK